jgi:polysaccharide export outer membrane protein
MTTQFRFLLCLLVPTVVALPLPAQNVSHMSVAATTGDLSSGSATYPLQIAAGDLLDLSVFDTPELSAKLRVDEHGAVTLPLGGSLSVSGLTAGEAGLAIQERFQKDAILKSPHVSVTVLEYSTQGVTILGEVKNPGVYPILGTHNLLDFISAAGGVTPNAGKGVTISHRMDSTHPVVVTMDSRPGNTGASNVDIRPGDTIIVSHAGIVYVVGDVGKPGGFLIENNDRLSVLQAIALAQGTNKTAGLNQTKLIRKTDSGRQEIPVPLKKILLNKASDELLADGDILFIPVSGTKSVLVGIEGALPQVAGAAIYRVP